jgi:hypothetical protein
LFNVFFFINFNALNVCSIYDSVYDLFGYIVHEFFNTVLCLWSKDLHEIMTVKDEIFQQKIIFDIQSTLSFQIDMAHWYHRYHGSVDNASDICASMPGFDPRYIKKKINIISAEYF